MSILIDLCVPQKFKTLLNDWGYEATFISEHIHAASADHDVIALAQELDAILLTVDLDFSNVLDYPPQNYQGIVVMRYLIKDETKITNTLKQALADLYRDKLRCVLVIIQPDNYRVRQKELSADKAANNDN